MSRNKQVDRLREGMKKHWIIGKIEDPVGTALGLIEVYRKDLVHYEQNQKQFFEGLHSELIYQGCCEELPITRKDGSTITLGELGFVMNAKFETDEDRARLIAITGMVLSSLRDNNTKNSKAYQDTIDMISNKYVEVCDKLHKTLMELGIWEDPVQGSFNDMLEAFRTEHVKVRNKKRDMDLLSRNEHDRVVCLRDELVQANVQIETQYKKINGLVKDLNYHRVRADQFEKELDAMRKSIIRSKSGQ